MSYWEIMSMFLSRNPDMRMIIKDFWPAETGIIKVLLNNDSIYTLQWSEEHSLFVLTFKEGEK